MNRLGLAIKIASEAHLNQLDLAGKPYILHCLAVMNKMPEDEDFKIVAVLHDLLEDTDWTYEQLKLEFGSLIADAIQLLSREQESYDHFIKRICNSENYLAIPVKIADLEHNMDIRRFDAPARINYERMAKYHEAWLKLNNTLHIL